MGGGLEEVGHWTIGQPQCGLGLHTATSCPAPSPSPSASTASASASGATCRLKFIGVPSDVVVCVLVRVVLPPLQSTSASHSSSTVRIHLLHHVVVVIPSIDWRNILLFLISLDSCMVFDLTFVLCEIDRRFESERGESTDRRFFLSR
jgi:hypothetical protein